MVVPPAFNPSTLEAEEDGSLRVQGQPGLQSEFQNSQGYTEKPCLKKRDLFMNMYMHVLVYATCK